MLLKYIGKRPFISHSYGHKRYVFSKENNFICEVPFETMKQLFTRGEYIPAEAVAELTKTEKPAEKPAKVVKKK